ncbi:MAG: sigma-54-dependent Fis family transcriptional regulator [Candidatus Omnitrophica bacterium]|nr:sigma-54-dependent Fis family transcriptional regulator [Candidatus Omnitrophota bacterium]
MMNRERETIFVIDDEPHILTMIKEALEEEGYQVSCYQNPLEGLEEARRRNPDLIIADLLMPELNGLELIHKIKTFNPEINVLVITGHASLDSAIGAIRAGASDYMIKPFKIADLLDAVRKALSQKRLAPKSSTQSKTLSDRYQTKNLIGTTAEMKEIFQLIEKIAKTESTVLVIGESGTGKEMVARSVHYQSRRKKGPFVSVNCAALPENLLESELFGYEKGAFTGAVASKVGLFELAESGTFLLDEVGDLSVNLQAKLLRVLQERILKRLGGVKDIPVDFRLIAATSKNLPEEIKSGRFREELFYRINVIPIMMPPLRKRREDIPTFVSYFLEFYSNKHMTNRKPTIAKEALAVLENYAWPGNIRELENVIERIVAFSDSDLITVTDVEKALQKGNFSSDKIKPINKSSDLKENLEVYERELIEQAIQKSKGNKNKAAKQLNLTRQALQYKISKYGIHFSSNG